MNKRYKKKNKILKQIKILLFLCLIIITLIPVVNFVAADSGDNKDFYEKINDLLDCLDFADIEKFYNEFAGDLTRGSSFKDEVRELISGKEGRNFKDVISYFINAITGNIKEILPSLLIVLIIAIVSGMFSSVGFNTKGVKDAVFLVCYAAASGILFTDTAKISVDSLSFLSNTCISIQSSFPLITTVSSLCGESNKIKVLSPICAFITQLIGFSVLKIMIPAIIGVCALSSVSALSEKSSLSSTRDAIVDVFKWIIGISVSLLSVFTSISGLGCSARDSISLKTLKYTVGNTVPIIGGFAKEGVDVVISAAQVIKSGIGSVFMVLIVYVFAKQFLRLGCFLLLLNIVNALCMPFADKRFCDMICGFKKTVSLIIVLFVAVTVLFFICCYVLLLTNTTI